jgi:hypothetical protein
MGDSMKILLTATPYAGGEADQERILALFSAWKPPVEIQMWSGFIDGTGFFGILDTDDMDAVAAITATWSPLLSFTAKPFVEVASVATAMAAGIEFRNSVG